MATPSEFGKTYNSFSGVDIKAVFGNEVIAEIQAISYSVTREKAPLYTMGSADPRSFSRGKRGIAGTLIFLVFDRHALLGVFGWMGTNPAKFMADIDDILPNIAGDPGDARQEVAIATLVGTGDNSIEQVNFDAFVAESPLNERLDADQEAAPPWYADQIPPFDITLAAANEYGAFASMRIYGVEILNEGYGVSIDDIVSEQQMTYVARTLVPWQPYQSTKTAQIYGSENSEGS
ncbi:MAG: hypothetical protein ACXABY_03020 [Candidatus Thorarchaeota archaeon]|jgi:hypothetical protein